MHEVARPPGGLCGFTSAGAVRSDRQNVSTVLARARALPESRVAQAFNLLTLSPKPASSPPLQNHQKYGCNNKRFPRPENATDSDWSCEAPSKTATTRVAMDVMRMVRKDTSSFSTREASNHSGKLWRRSLSATLPVTSAVARRRKNRSARAAFGHKRPLLKSGDCPNVRPPEAEFGNSSQDILADLHTWHEG